VAIKVTADTVAGGFVQPHSRVDIVSIIRRNEAETISKILLQNILVLAVDQTAVRSEDGKAAAIPNTVTVQVTPEQAEKLSMAQELGTLRLSLRPFGDEENVTTRGSTPKQILQGTANRADEAVGLEETGSSGRPVGLTRVPDVPSGKATAADAKPAEPTTPPRTHTLTIYNGDAVTKAVFTLDKAEEGQTKKEEKKEEKTSPEPTPASKKESPKTSPPKAKS
jgi:pilus assembly protein CpaB